MRQESLVDAVRAYVGESAISNLGKGYRPYSDWTKSDAPKPNFGSEDPETDFSDLNEAPQFATPTLESDLDFSCMNEDKLKSPAPVLREIVYLDDIQTANPTHMRDFLRKKDFAYIRELKEIANSYLHDEPTRINFGLYGDRESIALRALYAAVITADPAFDVRHTYREQENSGITNLLQFRAKIRKSLIPAAKTGTVQTA